MCVIADLTRSRVQALPDDDIAALREFAQARHEKAGTDGARAFWVSMIMACMSDDEQERYLAGLNVAAGGA